MRLLVTGASGFIGAAVIRQAVAAGHQVRGLVRERSRTDRIDGLPWQRACGDIRDAFAVGAALADCDAVIHLAGIVAWDRIDSPEVNDVVERGTATLLEAAGHLGSPRGAARRGGRQAPRVVVVSSTAAMGGTDQPRVLDETSPLRPLPPRLIYAVAKRNAEALAARAAATGLPVIVVRPAEVYGPGDRDLITARTLIDFATTYPVLVCRGGTSVAHVDDVAMGLVRAAERGRAGESYLLGGENLTLRELAVLCLDCLGRRAPIVSVPNSWLRAFTAVGLRLGIPLPYNAKAVPYATRFWFVDGRKARDELGVTFRGARETLMSTLEWLRASGRIPTGPARRLTPVPPAGVETRDGRSSLPP